MRLAVTALVALSAVASLSVAPAHAQGCGPTRLKVSESLVVDAPPTEVWARVGNFQDLAWNGEAAGSRGQGGNTPEQATRTVTLKGGARFVESLYRYDAAAMSYAWHIDTIDLARLPAQNVSATLEVAPAGDGRSVVRWKTAFYRNLTPGEGAPDAADAAAVEAMRRYVKASLVGLASAPRS